jgi:putative Mg2+ transporter-C (MgtC) family protein
MAWLLSNWRDLLPAAWAYLALTLAAVACGAIVGTERERREKAAGLRTLVLVCLGAEVFTVVSYAFESGTGDPRRIAAQVVVGIGFLGAGVILHGRTAVSGLTTAATIWAMAAVGVVAGVGYVGPALALSLLIRFVLTGGYWWEHRFIDEMVPTSVELVIDPNCGKTRLKLQCLLEDFQVQAKIEPLPAEEKPFERLRLQFGLPRRQRAEFLDRMADLADVRQIQVTKPDQRQG